MLHYVRFSVALIATFAVMAALPYPSAGQQLPDDDYYWRGTPTPSAQATAPAAGGRSTLERGYPQVCSGLETLFVPRAAVEQALEDPQTVGGWNRPANPNRPVSWTNPRRRLLTLERPSAPFHPLYNALQFKSSCAHK